MKKGILFISFFLSIIGCSWAQTLSGTIANLNNEHLADVHIYLLDLQRGTITTKDGSYSFSHLPNKILKVQISSLGFETLICSVDMRLGSQVLNFELVTSVIEMKEVLLSGGFVSSQDRSVVKITSKKLSILNRSASPSLLINLSSEPGVEMISQGNSIMKPVIRGLSGNRVLSIYQGVRIENQAWGKEHGVYIPEEGLDRIEVIKGPASLLYGSDAMGGVLNFIPEKPLYARGRETRVSLNGFSNTNGYQATLWTKKRRDKQYHAFGSGYHAHNDYLQSDGDTALNSRFTQFYTHGLWGYSMPWGIIEGVYSASYTNAGIMIGSESPGDSIRKDEPWQQSGDHIITTQATFWWGDWTLKPHISYQLNHRKEFDRGKEFNDEASIDMELRTSRFDFKALRSYRNLELIIGSQGMHQENANVGSFKLIPNATTTDKAIFSLMHWKKGKVQVQFGVRFDHRKISSSTNNETAIPENNYFYDASFSLGGTYKLNETTVFRTNLAQGYRAPSLFELYADGVHTGAFRYELGNNNLKSEHNKEWDVSLHKQGSNFTFDISLFDNHINDFIYSAPTQDYQGDYRVYEHLQTKARLYGGEFGFDIHPRLVEYLHFKSSVTVVYGDNLSLNKPLPLMPPVSFLNELKFEKSEWRRLTNLFSSIELEYKASQNRLAIDELNSSSYMLINFGVGLSYGKLDLGLFARNLLNKEYIPHLSLMKGQGIFNPGRNIAIKISTTF